MERSKFVASPFFESLVVRRRFDAPIEEVFDAWTDAEVLAAWFGPPGFQVNSVDIDLKPGGSYLIVIQSPDGKEIKHFGKYLEVLKPIRLIFTWMLADQACKGSENQCAETLVSIDFVEQGESTEINLTHEKLPNKEAFDGHAFGWESSFQSFECFFRDKNFKK